MGLYGSQYDYIIHIALMATKRVTELVSSNLLWYISNTVLSLLHGSLN